MTALSQVAQSELLAPIPPHGGALQERLLPEAEREAARARAAALPTVPLSPRQLADLELFAGGALSPLTGFLGREDYTAVVEEMRLADGTVWPLPVTLAVDRDRARALHGAEEVALAYEGRPLALLRLREAYEYDKAREARLVYGTDDARHPGVAALYGQGDVLLAGEVDVFDLPERPFAAYRLTPRQTREAFAARGWRTVVAFQTRNPVHRAHEYIQKCALEIVDGLLLHPLVGETKDDDVPAEVRLRCYEVLLAGYYPRDRVLLAVFPAAMRYAGPREAVFHALVRKNYGCTHIIIGRDHAGVGNYYGTYDAQRIFDRFRPEEIGITPLKFEHTFWCRACGGMASAKVCPHDAAEHVTLSGTRVRELLRAGERPPAEFTRPEVADVLIAAYRNGAA
jgi:sulfate adenylyltransferase